jgi:O-methyltransferase involved in polyketide biosynthesis
MTTSSLNHDQLVVATIAEMKRQGMTRICADHLPGYVQPDQIGVFIPDVTALTGNAMVIAEAESREGLAAAHTQAQWKAFHSHANRVGGHFIAVVNRADQAAAQTLLNQICGGAANAHL